MVKKPQATTKTTREKTQEQRFIRLEGKPVWKRAKGPQTPVRASTFADKRCKRQRTRAAVQRKALEE